MNKECFYNAISAILGCVLGVYCGYNIHKQIIVKEESDVKRDTTYVDSDKNFVMPVESNYCEKGDSSYVKFVFFGFKPFNGELIPSIGMPIKTPKTRQCWTKNGILNNKYIRCCVNIENNLLNN